MPIKVTEPLKSVIKYQDIYHQFHEKSPNWPICRRNGYFGLFVSTRYPTTRGNTRKSMNKLAPKPAAKLAPKKLYTFKDILNEFKTLNQVQSDPFKPEAHRKAHANLPQSFLLQPQLLDYFNLFLTDDLWKTITTNLN